MNDGRRISTPDGREKPRRQIAQEFILSHPTIGSSRCMSRDLSLSGVFVLGRFQGIVPGDTVGLEFSTGPGAAAYQFAASVARLTDDGIGLKFLSLDMDTYGALLDLTLMG